MPVKQSASKEEFLRALGLNVSDPDDKRRLQAMWVSASSRYAVRLPLTSCRKKSLDIGSDTSRQREGTS